MRSLAAVFPLIVLAMIAIPQAGFSLGIAGGTNIPLPIQWSQNSINMSQLQTLFAQNPASPQLQIQFPNGMNWNVTPSAVQQLYQAYAQKGAALGLQQLPDLSFSSLGDQVLDASHMSIPIQTAMINMQQQSDEALDKVRYQTSSFMNMLPDWLRNILQSFADAIMALWGSICDKVGAMFR